MGALKLVVVVAAVAVVVVQGQGENPLLPDIWKVVEDSYDSRVTVNFLHQDILTTMLVDELYDISEQKGALEAIARGTTITTNYYKKSDQAFVTEGTTCTVRPVKELDQFGLWGWLYNNEPSEGDATNFLYGPSALLRLVRDYSREAVHVPGEWEVRGIKADKWLIMAKEYILYYYFASEVWLMPYGHVLEGVELRAPLRVEVIGVQSNPWNVGAEPVNQTVLYEYTEFKPYVELIRKKHFLVHERLHCEGRKSLDPETTEPPVALNDFQVFIETVMREPDSEVQVLPKVYRSWLYYSGWSRLLRIDVNPEQDPLEPERSYKSIHDYNTGIQYKIDMETGECDMKVLDEYQLGIQLGSGIIADVIMGDVNKPFFLDGKYLFNGYSETRGIKTSRWTATRDDIIDLESGKNYNKVVVDYQFSLKGTKLGSEEEDTEIPVRVDVTVYANDTNIILKTHTANFLHMQSSFQMYDFNPFHVGECMDTPVMRKWIKFTYLGDWDKGASQAPDAFKKQLINNIVKHTDASFIRFPEVQLQRVNSEVVHATALILEPAPYVLQFKKVDDRSPTKCDDKSIVNIFGEEGCAHHCLTYDDFSCKSFYECRKATGKGCYVSNYKNNVPATCEALDVPLCNHYNKALIQGTKFQRPIFAIEIILIAEIELMNFNVTLTYQDSNGETQQGVYHPTRLDEAIVSDDPFFVDLMSVGYRRVFSFTKLKPKYTKLKKSQVSYGYCLGLCMEQVAFDCQSFSYCYDSSLCMLASYEVTTFRPSDLIIQQDCVVIAKSHLLNYDTFEGNVYQGDAIEVRNDTSLEYCALLCDNATDFTCRSFDHCSDSDLCQLYDHHTADQPDGMFNASVGCSHFSRNELIDFTKKDNQEIGGTRDRFIKDTKPSYCAHVCVNEPDFSCNGFDYCIDGLDVTCFLTSDHYSDAGVDISDSLTCDHYSRVYYEGATRGDVANTPSKKYVYRPGDMAALGCSMVIISIALTFAGVFAYNKVFKK